VTCSAAAVCAAVFRLPLLSNLRLPLLSNLRLPRALSMFAKWLLSVESRLTVPVTLVVDVPTCVTGTGFVLVFWTSTFWNGVVAAWTSCSRNTVAALCLLEQRTEAVGGP